METKIDFSDMTTPQPSVAVFLSAPPALRLALSGHGRIELYIGKQEAFAPVPLGDLSAQMADMWLWFCATALGLLPVTLRLHDAIVEVSLGAERVANDRLRLTVARTPNAPIRPGDGSQPSCIVWEEPQQAFLTRWGQLWADWAAQRPMDAAYWEHDPDPMIELPWAELARLPAFDPSSWPRAARVAWFWLQMGNATAISHWPGTPDTPSKQLAVFHYNRRLFAEAQWAFKTARAAWAAVREDAAPGDMFWRYLMRTLRQKVTMPDMEGSTNDSPVGNTGWSNFSRGCQELRDAAMAYRNHVLFALAPPLADRGGLFSCRCRRTTRPRAGSQRLPLDAAVEGRAALGRRPLRHGWTR